MKLVKNIVLAVLLASFLAVSAPAGELGTPGVVGNPPPPPPVAKIICEENPVDFYGDPKTTCVKAETSDYLFFEALAALLSIY